MTLEDQPITKRLAPRSRRWILFAAIGATVLALGGIAAALVIGPQSLEQQARAEFDAATARLADAAEAQDAAYTSLESARETARAEGTTALGIATTTDPNLLADAKKLDPVKASVENLDNAAERESAKREVIYEGSWVPLLPTSSPDVPSDRAVLIEETENVVDLTRTVNATTQALAAQEDEINSALGDVQGAVADVVASAYEKGSATPSPELASQETKDAYAAAVAALEKPAANADLAALVSAYQSTWAATVASHDAASGADDPTPPSGGGLTYVDGVLYIDGTLIVNKTYPLPSWYGDGLTAETQAAFNQMQSTAAYYGLNLYISSGFRSYDTQVSVYNNYVSSLGQAGADRTSARPGHSEHQSGLAFDLNTIDHAFASTAEGQFVRDYAYQFGLIIRYPEGKESITGYEWEPWHIRYVGVELATKLHSSGQTLEEYFGITSAY